ncbi:MAG: 50S ribosomal protein L1, partial [Alphaproteobacteria bacterium]|nr:50S ribosomal protein L1 [Alphaproteobacteria bacterium]
MAHIGKRIAKTREGVERTKLYAIDEAVKLVR